MFVLSLPYPFSHPREHSKHQGSYIVIPTKGVSKNSFIRLEGVVLFVRIFVYAFAPDRRVAASSSRIGRYTRPSTVYLI